MYGRASVNTGGHIIIGDDMIVEPCGLCKGAVSR